MRRVSILKALSWLLTVSALLAVRIGHTQVVAVMAGEQAGHGFMIRDAGVCYLLLPRHVAEGQRLVLLRSAAPVTSGQAWIETPFWRELDLAIGVVRGDLAQRCDVPLSALARGATPRAEDHALELVRLRESGELDRVPMRLDQTRYLTFDAVTARPGDELFKGTSGAFVYAGTVPVGMAIEAPTPTTGLFVHMEEIHLNAARWLARRGGVFAADTQPKPAVQAPGFAVELVRAEAPPLAAQFTADNLLGEGAYVFRPQGPNRLVFRIVGDVAVNLSKVTLEADLDGGHALPRDIRVEVSSRADGGPPYRFFASGRMAPDGRFEQQRSATLARWIHVSVDSAWSEGPVRLDAVRFE